MFNSTAFGAGPDRPELRELSFRRMLSLEADMGRCRRSAHADYIFVPFVGVLDFGTHLFVGIMTYGEAARVTGPTVARERVESYALPCSRRFTVTFSTCQN